MADLSTVARVMFANIPDELREFNQWVAWKAKDLGAKFTKIPVNPLTGLNASTSDPATWASFEDACAYYEAYISDGKVSGIGFVFTKDDPFCGVDLDHCRDPETGELEQWAVEVLHDLGSYCEVSPSNTGVKAFIKGTLPGGGRNFGNIEIYDTGRYFTVTGHVLHGFPKSIQHRSTELTDLYNRLEQSAVSVQVSVPDSPCKTGTINDIDALPVNLGTKKLIREGEPAGKRSEAIMSVLGSLVHAGISDQDIISIFEDFPIGEKYREKGKNRVQWLQPQINKARGFVQEEDNNSAGDQDVLVFPYHIMSGAAGYFANTYGDHLETPKEFLYMGYLTCLGNVLGGKLTIKSEISPQPRLYTLLLGQSADERKSTALKKAVDHFKDCADEFHVCWGVGSAEGLQKRIEEAPDGLLLTLDEFKQFVSKCKIQSSVLLPCVNTLFESNHYESRTKTAKIELHDAYLSMLAASTVQTYEGTWDSSFTDIGFTNRIFLVPGSAKRRHSLPSKVSDHEAAVMRGKLENILQHCRFYRELDISPEASAIYHNWYMNMERSIHAKRLDTYALRLMSLLAVNDLKDEIDQSTVLKVIELCDWQLSVRRIYDPIDAEGKIAKMEEAIRRQLRKGVKSERKLKQNVNYARIGIWAYQTAMRNLEKYKEIAFNSRSNKWKLVS